MQQEQPHWEETSWFGVAWLCSGFPPVQGTRAASDWERKKKTLNRTGEAEILQFNCLNVLEILFISPNW